MGLKSVVVRALAAGGGQLGTELAASCADQALDGAGLAEIVLLWQRDPSYANRLLGDLGVGALVRP